MLQPTKDVPYRIISRDDFQQYLLSTADEDTTPEWRAAEQNFLKRLGLLAPDADLERAAAAAVHVGGCRLLQPSGRHLLHHRSQRAVRPH